MQYRHDDWVSQLVYPGQGRGAEYRGGVNGPVIWCKCFDPSK